MDESSNFLYYFYTHNFPDGICMATRKAATRTSEVPQFSLYGEETRPDNAEFVHIELIETRSRLHDWHIQSHTHRGLFQVLFLMSGHVSAEIDNAVWECEGPVAITIHQSVVHGFAFSEEAVGFVLTVDQNVVFAVGSGTGADSQTDIFATLFVQPLAIDLQAVPEVRE